MGIFANSLSFSKMGVRDDVPQRHDPDGDTALDNRDVAVAADGHVVQGIGVVGTGLIIQRMISHFRGKPIQRSYSS